MKQGDRKYEATQSADQCISKDLLHFSKTEAKKTGGQGEGGLNYMY
jgi:hypothetical protein